MTRECDARDQAVATPLTLWLSLRLGHQNWLFEFCEGDERAIVVGRFPRANVHVDRRGVAPIHFHFERDGDRILLIPGYRDELLVNGLPIDGAHALEPSSRIEFARLELEAHFFAVESDLLLPVSSRVSSRHERRRAIRAWPLADPLSRTSVAFPAHTGDFDAVPDATPIPKALRTAHLATEMRALSQKSESLSASLRAVPSEQPRLELSCSGTKSRPLTIAIDAKKPRRRRRLGRLFNEARSAFTRVLKRLLARR